MSRWFVVALCACGRGGFEDVVDATHGDGDSRSLVDAAPCTEPWSAPVEVMTGVTHPGGPSISTDDLELFVDDADLVGPNGRQLWVSHRTDRTQPFGAATVLPSPPNSANADSGPSISSDGLDLYFVSNISSNAIASASHRATRASAFQASTDAGPRGEGDVSRDGLTYYAQDFTAPIRAYRRTTPTGQFTMGTDLDPIINDGSHNRDPAISFDDRELYFTSDRSGGFRIWVASRSDPAGPFTTVNMVDVNEDATAPDISADGHHLYYAHGDGTTTHIQVVSRCE